MAAAQQTWTGPGNDFNAAINWTPNTVPGAGQTAVFQNTGPFQSNVTANTTIDGVLFGANSNAQNFEIHLTTGNLTLTGAGVIDNIATPRGGAFRQTIVVETGRTLTFQNSATVNTGGSSDAAALTALAGSTIRFEGTSSGGDAQVNVLGTLVNARTSGSLTLGDLSGSGTIRFDGGSTNLNVNAGVSSIFGGSIIDGVTAGSLTLNSGTLILRGTNTYTGGTTLSGGVLELSQSGSVLGNITNNATLRLSPTGSFTYANDISGTGTVNAIGGAGVTTLTGTNTYSGGTTVGADRTLQLGAGGITGSLTGPVALGSATSVLAINRSNTTTLNGVVSGAGSLQQNGSGTTILGAANTYTGGTTINNGILQLGPAGNLGTGTALAVNAPGVFDLNGRSQTVGDLSGAGSIALNGAATLTVGAAASTTFAGQISGNGGLTKSGSGTLTLSNVNSYTGSTTVAGGTLDVSGTIVSAATINSGATLTGSGIASTTTVSNGGALAPNGVLRLNAAGGNTGSVTFLSNSDYRITATPAQNDLLLAAGTADLAGGTVRVAASGTYRSAATYLILNAASGIVTPFAGVTTNLAYVTPTLSYDAYNVFLTFDNPNFVRPGQSNSQNMIGTALTQAATQAQSAAGEQILADLSGLDAPSGAAALDALAGGATATTQEASFFAATMFNTAMLDQAIDWSRGDNVWNGGTTLAQGRALGYAKPKPRSNAFDKLDALAQLEQQDRTWRTWIAGYGGARSIGGTAGFNLRGGGGTAGLDYQINPDLLVGFAVGGSTVSFSVPDRQTTGWVDGGQIGLYGMAKLGQAYVSGAVSYAHYSNNTNRIIAGVGATETVNGRFGSDQITGSFEAGWRQSFDKISLTPFASVQFIDTFQKAYDETSVVAGGGPGILGLQIGNRTATSAPLTVGLRADARVPLGDGVVWTPYGMAAWSRDLSPDRGINAALLSLPNDPFVVPSIAANEDILRLKAGSKLAFNDRGSLFFDVESQLSGRSHSYTYKGGLNLVLDGAPLKAGTVAAPTFTSSVSAEAHYSSWTGTRGFPASLGAGARGSGYQFYETLTGATTGVFTNDLKLELQARTGHVYSEQTTPGLSGRVSTPMDTVVSSTVTYSGFVGFAPYASLNFNLPTGRSVLKGNVAFARMDSDFVDLGTFGEGFNQGVTLGSNIFLSDEWTLSVSGGYTHRGYYDREAPIVPDGSQATQRLLPGDSASASFGLNYRKDSFFGLVNATYTRDSTTFLNGAPSFQSGDRFLASATMQNTWSDQSRTSFNGFMSLGNKNEILDPTLVILSAEAANSNSKVFRVQFDHTFVKDNWEFGPTVSYLRRYENSFSPITFSYVPAKRKISTGAQVKYSFTDAFSLNAKLEHFWSTEDEQPDKDLQGVLLAGTGTPTLYNRGWTGVITGTYNF